MRPTLTAVRTIAARVESPVHAASAGVERVDVAGDAADEDATADDRERRPRLHVTGKAEGPLQLEPRHIGSRRSRCPTAGSVRSRGSVRIRSRRAETIRWKTSGVDRHIAFGAGSIVKRSPSDLPLANSASARRSAVVRPCVIDTIDPNSSTSRIRCGVIAAKHVEAAGAIDASVMTTRAVLLVERAAILRQRGDARHTMRSAHT